MANDDEINLENFSEFIFDELLEAFYELTDDFKEIKLKNKELKKSNIILAEEKNKLLMNL